jgi:hypothetical protein
MKKRLSFKKGEIENIIKEEEAFTMKKTKSVQKDTGKFNDDYYKDVTKKFKDYNEPLKATEKENSDAVMKYTNSEDNQEYVDLANYNQGSIANLIPDNNPGEDWFEKQRQAITGEKSIQGNSVDYSNVYQEEPGFKGKKANQEIYDNNIKFLEKKENAIKTAGMGDFQQLVGKNKLKENKKQVKMKRLRFKKPFTGVENALRLIPESYKVDNKTFQMTDGNEKYEIRWEGNINEGRAIILKASDKVLMNEDMQKMKHLMQYNSKDTLGNLRGKERINENKVFNDVWNKTKSIKESSAFGFGFTNEGNLEENEESIDDKFPDDITTLEDLKTYAFSEKARKLVKIKKGNLYYGGKLKSDLFILIDNDELIEYFFESLGGGNIKFNHEEEIEEWPSDLDENEGLDEMGLKPTDRKKKTAKTDSKKDRRRKDKKIIKQEKDSL